MWTYNPVYPEEWTSVFPKIFVIGAEANDERPRPDRDMGLWFRKAHEHRYWENPKFFRGTLLQLRTPLGIRIGNLEGFEEDLRALKHLRYLDLKATGGTANVERTVDIAD